MIQTRVESTVSSSGATPTIVRAGVVRTARLLLAGRVFVSIRAEALAA
jgi:hypothetical protein